MEEIILASVFTIWFMLSEKLSSGIRNFMAIVVDIIAVVLFCAFDFTIGQRIFLVVIIIVIGCSLLLYDNRGRGLNAKIEIKETSVADFFFCAGMAAMYIMIRS